ncbi:hypothetical protein PHISP_02021 [Aspergillus sp. HF37]|nr:hypothetical protein PHISP_02021 [Aspergillus sp. HF37]
MTPILFESINFTDFKYLTSPAFNKFLSIPHLHRVKHLSVDVENPFEGDFYPETEAELYELFNHNLIGCLKRMRNLVSFEFGKGPVGPERDTLTSYATNNVPLFNETLAQLRSHTHLRSLSITTHKHICVDIHRNAWSDPFLSHWTNHVACELVLDVGGFRNLTSLYLGNIARGRHGYSTLVDQLSSTLLASPKLRDLALGLHHGSETIQFVTSLCETYKTAGGKPKLLENLQLGHWRYGNNPISITPRPIVRELSQLCNPASLGCLSLFNDLKNWPPRSDWDAFFEARSLQPNFGLSIRRYAGLEINDDMLSLLNKIGNDSTLPPHFMSEMHFRVWLFYPGYSEELGFDEHKRTYWPKCFSIEKFIPVRAADRHRIFRKIQQWTGLERLHLPLDLTIRDDRTTAFGLAKALKDRLAVLSLGMMRCCCTTLDEQADADTCIYTENPATGKRSHHIANGIPLWKKLGTADQKLRFAKKLCAVGNLKFLGIFNTFFEIHKATARRTLKQRPFNVAWLQWLTIDEREWAEFYDLLFIDGSSNGMCWL